ncbi:PREDICTED: uncharacterized protein LOC104728192 [Camelina sativa]|uniref:Uncharacterized protein LOC104728192 n=1 Tax=Camelina sativa TaxID=90675 RepID=A0ABM0USG1_CAMSA|nr:PREDICTED: uncharacterized protein LOC104728192 [Camelina sativa]
MWDLESEIQVAKSLGLFGLVAYSYTWIHFNPSPANLMFISSLKLSPSVGIETVLSQSLCQLVLQRYSIFWAYPSIPEPTGISVAASGNWLWESLLEATDAAVANTLQVLLHQDEIYSPWFCSLCFVPCHSFDDFIMHFKSDNHLLRVSIVSLGLHMYCYNTFVIVLYCFSITMYHI